MDSLDQPLTFFDQISRLDLVSILLPGFFAFVVGILITPIVTHFMFKHELWKKKSVAKSVDGKKATITAKLHADEKRKVPRMGGLVIVLSIIITVGLFWAIGRLLPDIWVAELDLVDRNETWLPLFALLSGFVLGVLDDLAVVGKLQFLKSKFGKYAGDGLSLKMRILLVAFVGAVAGWWFYSKLGVDSIFIPFWQDLHIGVLIIPFIVMVMVATYSGGIIDGIDGLSGGVFSIIFSSYALIALLQGRLDLAALCVVIVSGLLAFLWFNIPPARFYMSETGTMALTLTVSIIAFITDTALLLPIIAFPLLISTLSVMIQVTSKKFRGGKKVFIVSPIHNHYQALGWPGPKVVMRYWVFSQFMAVGGLIIFLLGY